MRDAPTQPRPVVFAVLLIVLGVIGWIAAFALTNDKFAALESPEAGLGCDFSLLVQCSANLDSPQGAIFGFPNPLIGVAAWIAPIVVGAGLLAAPVSTAGSGLSSTSASCWRWCSSAG
ncbi:Vitamin K epoxide reductase family protein [Rathayibacter tanaceti]|uniref:Vitamin K epoxide reductase family protein n=1 Tax=Rathayibacter tanaceti TaxID=1671680 RepID=A0A166IN34_9MICO|nr:Vitamin K epoxide reductase family protein [Rathayibacter tanaceti]